VAGVIVCSHHFCFPNFSFQHFSFYFPPPGVASPHNLHGEPESNEGCPSGNVDMKMVARGKHYTAAEAALLAGKKSNRALARKLGRSLHSIRKKRSLLHIRLLKPWRPEDDKVLGTRPDAQVALLLGRPLYQVSHRRRQLGIPCHYEHKPWTTWELELLGVKPDAEVARLTRHPLKAVRAKRQELGRPKPDQIMDYWQPEEDQLLGTMPDSEVAKKIKRSTVSVTKRRLRLDIPNRSPARHVWTQKQLAQLGTMSDRKLAEQIGCPEYVVTFKRRSLKISASRPH
jgi:hypothetical protein